MLALSRSLLNREYTLINVLKALASITFPPLYTENSRVEAGCNASTVALRVVEGDEKGTRCLGI
jgi:hypothetical protein